MDNADITQGTCSTEDCPNDRTRSSELCRECYDEASLCQESDRRQGR